MEVEDQIRKVLIKLIECNELCGHYKIDNVSTSSLRTFVEGKGKNEVWSEEDEICYQNLIEGAANYFVEQPRYVDWLKSVKQRLIKCS